ncbi:MAG TPA: hypothetical protein VKG21_14060 [Casimicrobiaceae bacterium]|nr:hypothetical protein [Casimicrobiaceae bacterium]
MNTFKRKSLYAALAGVGALGVTGAAQAVNVNPDGLGQALVYPYYTTQGLGTGGTTAPYNSLLSVINSTNSGKVVKVRFLEGRGSKEVLDFNLWLSPRDVWTTAVIPSGSGAGIFTTDLSCTTPPVSSNPASPTNFVNFAYVGDPEDQTLARTKEGYIEIIEMGNVTGGTLTAITHAQPSPPGKPPGCGGLPVGLTAPTDLVPGNGGLFGGISLVNVLAGGDVTEDAIALASFSATTLWAPAGSIQPDLSQVNPKTSVVFNNVEVVTTDWTGSSNSVDAVSAVFMHDNIYNEFVLDTGTKSATDWVVTMPTKHFYYTNNNVTKLFQRNFRAGGACDDVLLVQFNREEQTVLSQTTFSPPPPTFTDSLCWEANVIIIANTDTTPGVLLSKNATHLVTTFSNGWISLNWLPGTVTGTTHQLIGGPTIRTSTATGVSTTQNVVTYSGLPVVGFAAEFFNNGTLTGPPGQLGVQAFYTGSFVHKYTRLIQ